MADIVSIDAPILGPNIASISAARATTQATREELRVTALEKYACKRQNSPEDAATIAINQPPSPNKTTSTVASDTALPAVVIQRQGSATFSVGTVPKGVRSHSPQKRSVSAVKQTLHQVVGKVVPSSSVELATSQTSEGDASGLDFLLQACATLEPDAMSEEDSRRSQRDGSARYNINNDHSQQEDLTRSSRRRRTKRRSDEMMDYSQDEDEEYQPQAYRRGGTAVRRTTTGAARTARTTSTVEQAAKGAPIVRWERGMVHGPCMNPDCDYPEESPQWRKGPPNAPILCNACGTRWLRNGTLKPLVPRRGIRYNSRGRSSTGTTTTTTKSRSRAAATTWTDNSADTCRDADRGVNEAENELSSAHEALANAMAALPSFITDPSVMLQAASTNDRSVLQQQLAAMTAVAAAAQQAIAAAKAQATGKGARASLECGGMPEPANTLAVDALAVSAEACKPVTVNVAPVRPIFNIQAVAGPAVVASTHVASPAPLHVPSPAAPPSATFAVNAV